MKLHKQMYYFETAKVRPSKEDGDCTGCILAWSGLMWDSVHYSSFADTEDKEDDLANLYTHWMQMPKAPSIEDQDF